MMWYVLVFVGGLGVGAYGAYQFFMLGLQTRMVLRRDGVEIEPRTPAVKVWGEDGKELT